jgi:cytochrome c-type biogenesis protein CcmH/NrfG
LELDPEEALAWKVLGNTQLILGQEDEAVAAFAQAVALDPDDTESWFLRGQLELRQRKSEQAVHSLRQAASRGHQPAAKLLNQVFKGR